MSADHRGWPGAAKSPPPGPGGWPGAVLPRPAGSAGYALPGISTADYLRMTGARMPPAPEVKAPEPHEAAPLSAEIEDLEEAAELAEMEAADRETDEAFDEEFNETDDEDLDEEEL